MFQALLGLSNNHNFRGFGPNGETFSVFIAFEIFKWVKNLGPNRMNNTR